MASSTSVREITVSLPMPSSEFQSWTSPVSSSVSVLPSSEKSGKHWKMSFFLEPSISRWEEVHRLKPRLPRGWARRVLHSHGHVIIEGCGCDKMKAVTA